MRSCSSSTSCRGAGGGKQSKKYSNIIRMSVTVPVKKGRKGQQWPGLARHKLQIMDYITYNSGRLLEGAIFSRAT